MSKTSGEDCDLWPSADEELFILSFRKEETFVKKLEARRRQLLKEYLRKEEGTWKGADDIDLLIVQRGNPERWKALEYKVTQYLGSRGLFFPPCESITSIDTSFTLPENAHMLSENTPVAVQAENLAPVIPIQRTAIHAEETTASALAATA